MKITTAGNCYSEYPTRNAFNADNSKCIVVYTDHDVLHDTVTGAAIKSFKSPVGPSSRPSWDITNPNILYTFNMANGICRYDITTDAVTLLRAFPKYAAINNGGEADISPDGTRFIVSGDNGFDIFVYNIFEDKQGPILQTDGRWNGLYMTPDNNVLITWNADTGRGIVMYDQNMVPIRQVAPLLSHQDVCRYNGKEVLIYADNVKNAIMMIPLSVGYSAATVLYQFTDWTLASHISAPDSNPGYIYIETYDPKNPASTVIHANAILRIWLADGRVEEIAKHNSNCTSDITQPKTTSSHDGSKLLFGSNSGILSPLNYMNAYLIDTSAAQVAPSAPANEQIDKYGEKWLNMGTVPYDEMTDSISTNSGAKTLSVYRRE